MIAFDNLFRSLNKILSIIKLIKEKRKVYIDIY